MNVGQEGHSQTESQAAVNHSLANAEICCVQMRDHKCFACKQVADVFLKDFNPDPDVKALSITYYDLRLALLAKLDQMRAVIKNMRQQGGLVRTDWEKDSKFKLIQSFGSGPGVTESPATKVAASTKAFSRGSTSHEPQTRTFVGELAAV